jgi:hypothetical protein
VVTATIPGRPPADGVPLEVPAGAELAGAVLAGTVTVTVGAAAPPPPLVHAASNGRIANAHGARRETRRAALEIAIIATFDIEHARQP